MTGSWSDFFSLMARRELPVSNGSCAHFWNCGSGQFDVRTLVRMSTTCSALRWTTGETTESCTAMSYLYFSIGTAALCIHGFSKFAFLPHVNLFSLNGGVSWNNQSLLCNGCLDTPTDTSKRAQHWQALVYRSPYFYSTILAIRSISGFAGGFVPPCPSDAIGHSTRAKQVKYMPRRAMPWKTVKNGFFKRTS